MKKLLSFILAIMTCFSVVACDTTSTPGTGGGGTPPTPTGTVNDVEVHRFEGGVHKFNIGTTDITFVENGVTEYSIVVPDEADMGQLRCASTLTRFVNEAMGATISTLTESEVTWSEDKKYLVVDCDGLFNSAGLTMPEENLGESGYYIKNKGNSVFLMADFRFGASYSANAFLKEMIGLEFFDGESYVFNTKPGDKIMLPDFDVVDIPDIEWNNPTNNVSSATQQALRITGQSTLFMNVSGGGTWHNTLEWLPTTKWATNNPEWYSEDKRELCYTAHGNQAKYDAMVEECVNVAVRSFEESDARKEGRKVVTFTVMDGGYYCTCDACTASKNHYGCDSAALIKFVNKVGRGLKERFEEKAEAEGTPVREGQIIFFAYNQTCVPPVKEVDGKLVPFDDSVVLEDNIGVYFVPLGVTFSKTMYDAENESMLHATRGWNVLTDNIYLWFYNTNFYAYLYPWNNWSSIAESYRLFAENGVLFILSQGQFNQGYGTTSFAAFREYLNAELRWDCNQNYLDLEDRFFKGYFKEAEEPLRRYFHELTAHMSYLQATYSSFNGKSSYNPVDEKYWPLRTLNQWLGYLDEAYALIEPLKETNPVRYANLYKNVLQESIFLRLAKLTLYSGTYSSDDLLEARIALKDDCSELNITRTSEQAYIDAVWTSWGII